MVFPDKTAVSKKQGGAWGNAVMYTAGQTADDADVLHVFIMDFMVSQPEIPQHHVLLVQIQPIIFDSSLMVRQ
ncbi:MAG: hypothetical protein V3G42_09535 [Oscillospiraceae bacterium]